MTTSLYGPFLISSCNVIHWLLVSSIQSPIKSYLGPFSVSIVHVSWQFSGCRTLAEISECSQSQWFNGKILSLLLSGAFLWLYTPVRLFVTFLLWHKIVIVFAIFQSKFRLYGGRNPQNRMNAPLQRLKLTTMENSPTTKQNITNFTRMLFNHSPVLLNTLRAHTPCVGHENSPYHPIQQRCSVGCFIGMADVEQCSSVSGCGCVKKKPKLLSYVFNSEFLAAAPVCYTIPNLRLILHAHFILYTIYSLRSFCIHAQIKLIWWACCMCWQQIWRPICETRFGTSHTTDAHAKLQITK